MIRLAILDDYQRVALRMADWSEVQRRCEITVFDRRLAVPDEAAEALAPFDIICLLRERMPVPKALIDRLPRLRFIAVTGLVNRTLDLHAATAKGIVVSHSRVSDNGQQGRHGTVEIAWGLILALSRHLVTEAQRMRQGGWQTTVGRVLHGKRLGLLGLGTIGRGMARVGQAFGMDVVAWSRNLTDTAAAEVGVRRVELDELLQTSDVVSVHLVLGDRSRGLLGARELALMKPTALLINTARGPIVDERALIDALRERRIAGAGLDVFDIEPLPDDHPLRRHDNVVLTPHLGYTTEESLRAFYRDTVEAVLAFLDGKPLRVMTPGS